MVRSKHGSRAFLESAAFANGNLAAVGSLKLFAPLPTSTQLRHQKSSSFASPASLHSSLALGSNLSVDLQSLDRREGQSQV
jgi:hypothetical protein